MLQLRINRNLILGRFVVGTIVSLASVSAALAGPVYTYTGQHFSYVGTGGDVTHVSGSFTVDSLLAPNTTVTLKPYTVGGTITEYSFTDGRSVWNLANYVPFNPFPLYLPTLFAVTTNAGGGISDWCLYLNSSVGWLQSQTANNPSCLPELGTIAADGASIQNNYNAWNNNSPGNWAVSGDSGVPEPSTLVLLLSGLGGLMLALRARRLVPFAWRRNLSETVSVPVSLLLGMATLLAAGAVNSTAGPIYELTGTLSWQSWAGPDNFLLDGKDMRMVFDVTNQTPTNSADPNGIQSQYEGLGALTINSLSYPVTNSFASFLQRAPGNTTAQNAVANFYLTLPGPNIVFYPAVGFSSDANVGAFVSPPLYGPSDQIENSFLAVSPFNPNDAWSIYQLMNFSFTSSEGVPEPGTLHLAASAILCLALLTLRGRGNFEN